MWTAYVGLVTIISCLNNLEAQMQSPGSKLPEQGSGNFGYSSTYSSPNNNGYEYSSYNQPTPDWNNNFGYNYDSMNHLSDYNYGRQNEGSGYGYYNKPLDSSYDYAPQNSGYSYASPGSNSDSYGYSTGYASNPYGAGNFGTQSSLPQPPFRTTYESGSWKEFKSDPSQWPSYFSQGHGHSSSQSKPWDTGQNQGWDSWYKRPDSYSNYYIPPSTEITEPPSYAPQPGFLESVLSGIKTSVSSSFKPFYGHGSAASEPWRPVVPHRDTSRPFSLAEFQQDDPHKQHALDFNSNPPPSKPMKHIYIHSTSDKLPEEVNLKLILLKPPSSSGYNDHVRHYKNDEGIHHMSTNPVTSSVVYPPLSDYKRSKINAQLHFVRYKSPLSSLIKWKQNLLSLRKKPTRLHFLISKRSSESSNETFINKCSESC